MPQSQNCMTCQAHLVCHAIWGTVTKTSQILICSIALMTIMSLRLHYGAAAAPAAALSVAAAPQWLGLA